MAFINKAEFTTAFIIDATVVVGGRGVVAVGKLSGLLAEATNSRVTSLGAVTTPTIPRVPAGRVGTIVANTPADYPATYTFYILRFFIGSTVSDTVPPSGTVVRSGTKGGDIRGFLSKSP